MNSDFRGLTVVDKEVIMIDKEVIMIIWGCADESQKIIKRNQRVTLFYN